MRHPTRRDWTPIRAEVHARLRAGQTQLQIQREMGLTQSKVSTWWMALPAAERAALRPRAASMQATYQSRYNAKLRAAERAQRLAHPSLAALRNATPSIETFERALVEVPELTRRACFDLPRQSDPLWPLAVWMLRRVRHGTLNHAIIGALYGLGRERVRQIEEGAIERALAPAEGWREHVRGIDQRGATHWDEMQARAS
jgi:hypothetical protein